jgi:hypothetical protein
MLRFVGDEAEEWRESADERGCSPPPIGRLDTGSWLDAPTELRDGIAFFVAQPIVRTSLEGPAGEPHLPGRSLLLPIPASAACFQ